jgi:hypothetical protein
MVCRYNRHSYSVACLVLTNGIIGKHGQAGDIRRVGKLYLIYLAVDQARDTYRCM